MSRVRLRESLLPGLGHFLRGQGWAAWPFLGWSAIWVAVVAGRSGALLRSVERGRIDDVLALLLLAAFPAAAIACAHGHLRRRAAAPCGERRTRRPSFVARSAWALHVLGALYSIALLAPVLAPYEPESIPSDTPPSQYRAPGETVTVFGHPVEGEIGCVGYRVEGTSLVLDRGGGRPPRTIALAELGEPRWGWLRGERSVRMLRIGGRTIPYREEFHLLGTDASGRDLLSRLIYGSRISLTIGFAAMGVAVALGALVGVVSGYARGLLDGFLMRLADTLLAFPRIVLVLAVIMSFPEGGFLLVVLLLGATGWMGVARLVRADVLRLRELDFTAAARALGAGSARIALRHLLPNALGPILVAAALRVGDTILLEAALSFLGFGVSEPTPSWGNIIHSGRAALLGGVWWISTLPGLAIVAAVTSFNLVGDSLRDRLDPRDRALERTA